MYREVKINFEKERKKMIKDGKDPSSINIGSGCLTCPLAKARQVLVNELRNYNN
jgi:hypothetical protein